jgi:hypothetical protein
MRDLVPVARLTSHDDAFHCGPFGCTLSARACLARRAATFTGGRMRGHTPEEHAAFPTCARCPIGALVAEQLADVPDPRAEVPATTRRRRVKRAVAVEGARHAF